MLTEQQLINSEVDASDDMDGMDSMIRSLWNEIARRRMKAVSLYKLNKTEAADLMKEETDNIQRELEGLIKSYTIYDKYLAMRNKSTGSKHGKSPIVPISRSIRDDKSSNGDIVQTIPSK